MPDIERLFQKYKDDVYRLALSYTKSPQEAEDVCQTVFLKLMEQAHVAPGKERSWLMQVTANTCRNVLRSAWWKQTVPMEETLPAPAPQYSDTWEKVMSLPPKYRVLVYLRYYEELTTGEMARLLHISQTAVTTRLSRARQMLKELLKEDVR
ncbi:MAG: sigma-70 family RNA polymerase sigma factor [Oscillospiraceae bacterium]|nr:sigma-70 family RNA polymerase sigma factor [Oscillospiraceae bacterium]